jgi:hypothetical protein
LYYKPKETAQKLFENVDRTPGALLAGISAFVLGRKPDVNQGGQV